MLIISVFINPPTPTAWRRRVYHILVWRDRPLTQIRCRCAGEVCPSSSAVYCIRTPPRGELSMALLLSHVRLAGSDTTPRFDCSDRELVRCIGRSTYGLPTRGVMVPLRQLQCSHNGSVGTIRL